MILSESVIVEYKKIARSSEYYMKKGYDLSTDTIEINIIAFFMNFFTL
jgi:hypothetical protein